MGKIWLDVPFAQKDEAKALGARWDPTARRWYAPAEGMAPLDRWLPKPASTTDAPVATAPARRHAPAPANPLPSFLPGEDRWFGGGLFVDLVPRSCWFSNARSCIAPADWERVKYMVTNRASNRCEACSATRDRATRRWLEVHERWEFRDADLTQVLRRLVCLCTDCHRATHFGLAQVRGWDGDARRHLMAVNEWSAQETEAHIEEAFEIWSHRNQFRWDLDLSILTDAGVEVVRPR